MLRVRFWLFIAIVPWVSACSTTTSNTPEPADLADIKQQIRIKEVWDNSYGRLDEHVSIQLQPAIDDNVVFTIDSDGDVTAFKRENGEVIWQSGLDKKITAGLGMGDEYLYAVTVKGNLLAISRKDGSMAWSKPLGRGVLATPVYAEGRVLVQTIDGRLVALDAVSGKLKWNYQHREPALSLRGTSTPVVMQGIAITGFGGGLLTAVKVNNGRLLWERQVSEPKGRNEVQRLADVDAPALIAGPRLFAVSYQGRLIAIDMRTGRNSWSKDVSSYQAMSADRKYVFVTDEFGVVRAYDQSSGVNVWIQNKMRGRRLSAPVVAGSYVVVGDYEGYTHWLDTATGGFVARYKAGSDPIIAQPLVRDGTVYVSTTGGYIAAISWN